MVPAMPRKQATHRGGKATLKAFGKRVRKLREELGVSRGAMADRLPTALYTLQRYEDGSIAPSILVLLDLCRELKVTPNDLLMVRP